MNVTLHVLGSLATASVLSLKTSDKIFNIRKFTIGFITGILIHGVLDYLPHSYPFSSKFDIIFALILFTVGFLVTQKQNRLLVLVCFAGAIFPDVIDLGGEIANKYLGIPVPYLSFNIFPWHWKEYSGSIYDGNKQLESNILHISFLLICFGLLYVYRKRFLRFWSE